MTALDDLRRRWNSLPTITRRALSALSLLAGVWATGVAMRPTLPRDVTVHVDLRGARDARALRVEFLRGDEVLRAVTRRLDGAVSVDIPTSLPEGHLTAHVELVTDDRVLVREVALDARAGERLELPLPSAEP